MKKTPEVDVISALPERLKELRNSFSYSQAFIAEKLCISRQTYSHYETGRIVPPADALCQLADLYHVSVDTLLSHRLFDAPDEKNLSAKTPLTQATDIEQTEYETFLMLGENKKKYADLSDKEKRLLFYYLKLDKRDQKDILDFMKLKYKNRSLR